MRDDTRGAAPVSIGELARATGIAVRTIRFYCDAGILESTRSAGGHRMFDPEPAVERLLLVRRLRALGLGLESITDVLHGKWSIDEAIAAETARLDREFSALAWRRAAVRAVGAAGPVRREERLALLAAVSDSAVAYEHLVRFWRGVLAPIPRGEVDTFIGWNVPEPPADPTVDQIVAYAELTALVADSGMRGAVRQQLWRTRPESVRDGPELYAAVGAVMSEVVPLVAGGVRPRGGGELDRFVGAHAAARGDHDSPSFRARLLSDGPDTDRRIDRYWALTERLLGPRITVGRAHRWVYDALACSASAAVN